MQACPRDDNFNVQSKSNKTVYLLVTKQEIITLIKFDSHFV